MKYLLASVTFFLFTQFGSQTMKPCTPSMEPAITVTLVNSQTKEPINGSITVEDGDFQEVLVVYGVTASGRTIYGGAFERPGSYTLRASKNGYSTVFIQEISVNKDECHVLTRHLDISLEPVQ